MGYLYFLGAECGDSSELKGTSNVSLVSSPARTGAYAYKLQWNAGFAFPQATLGLPATDTGFLGNLSGGGYYFRFALRLPSLPPSGYNYPILYGVGSSGKNPATNIGVFLDSGAHLSIGGFYTGVTGYASGTTALAANTWYAVEAYCSGSGWTVRLNGSQECTASPSPMYAPTYYYLGSNQASPADFVALVDDLAIGVGGYLGPGQVFPLALAGAGAYAAASGAMASVAEVPEDGDTSYVTLAGANAEQTYTLSLPSGITPGSTVNAVKVMVFARCPAGGANANPICRIGGTDVTVSSNAFTGVGGYGLNQLVVTTNPNTSRPLTVSDLSSMEVGVRNIGGATLRVTAIYAHADVLPAAGGGGGGTAYSPCMLLPHL